MKRPPRWDQCLGSQWVVCGWRRWWWCWYCQKGKAGVFRGRAVLPAALPVGLKRDHIEKEWKMKRVTDQIKDVFAGAMAVDLGTWGKNLPHITERLTTLRYDDGGIRVPGYVRIEVKGQAWQIQYVEPDGAVMLRLDVSSPDELFPALEAVLGHDQPPWQPASWLKPKLPRKGK